MKANIYYGNVCSNCKKNTITKFCSANIAYTKNNITNSSRIRDIK